MIWSASTIGVTHIGCDTVVDRQSLDKRRSKPNPAFERTRGSGRGSAMNFGARAAQRERWAAGGSAIPKPLPRDCSCDEVLPMLALWRLGRHGARE